MSTQYITEPPPTASVILHTTAGPLTISLFAQQTPLTSRNFIQHCLDGYYDGCTFHRISPGFVIQTGDPTNTGEGGQNIYDLERDYERYDAPWARELGREVGEKIGFGDEVHSRLKFNRRGLVGMARMDQGAGGKGGDAGSYGSQFFITLADCRRELDGKCTMFGRVEGDGIYNVVRIGEGELAEGTERPVYPEKILRTEVIEMPGGEAWRAMRKRERVALRGDQDEERPKKIVKREKKKGGKTMLSFGGDEEDDGEAVVFKPKKAKFNTALIDAGDELPERVNGTTKKGAQSHDSTKKHDKHHRAPTPPRQTHLSPSSSMSRSPEITHRRTPSFHDSTTQFPIRDPEVPSRSRSSSTSPPPVQSRQQTHLPSVSSLNAEIAALKASMRRGPDTDTSANRSKKLSALEQLIPSSSTRGRKRPRPGENNAKEDAKTLKMLAAFQARLDGAAITAPDPDAMVSHSSDPKSQSETNGDSKAFNNNPVANITEEARLCDLHFIANCQSCSKWDEDNDNNSLDPGSLNATAADPATSTRDRDEAGEEAGKGWMAHSLSFAKDRLGKDLNWKKKVEEELVVIDPREREKDISGKEKERKSHRKDKRKA